MAVLNSFSICFYLLLEKEQSYHRYIFLNLFSRKQKDINN